jgi:hypothetical protein
MNAAAAAAARRSRFTVPPFRVLDVDDGPVLGERRLRCQHPIAGGYQHGDGGRRGLANPYPGLTGRSERVDTFEDMRFLVVAFSSLALIVLIVPSHV